MDAAPSAENHTIQTSRNRALEIVSKDRFSSSRFSRIRENAHDVARHSRSDLARNLDILFLTIVAYQLYNWFRETSALRVLNGLAVSGAVHSVVRSWGLFLITLVFQVLWQVLLILLVIFFQSEIKQVLERVSPLRYLQSRRRDFGGVLADEIAQVSFDLAHEKSVLLSFWPAMTIRLSTCIPARR